MREDRDGYGRILKNRKEPPKRRNVLGEVQSRSDQQTSQEGTPRRRRNILAAMEVTSLVASEYHCASEMPGAHMLADVRHERFTQGIARGMNLADASTHAGFKSPQPDLLLNDHILNRIAYWRRLGAEAAGVTAERIERELASIAFSDLRKAVIWSGRTISLKGSDELDDATASAISEIKETKDGLAFKMHDKLGALGKLMSHIGMGVSRHEISGPNGKPIEHITSDMDAQKAAEAYMALIKGD